MQVKYNFCHFCLDISCQELIQTEDLFRQEKKIVRVKYVWQSRNLPQILQFVGAQLSVIIFSNCVNCQVSTLKEVFQEETHELASFLLRVEILEHFTDLLAHDLYKALVAEIDELIGG